MKCLVLLLAALPGLAVAADDDVVAEAFGVHAQATYVRQLKPAFESPYEGPHSLDSERAWGYSFTGTLAAGARLGNTEVYADAEVAQGVAFSGLQGLAAFSNGELARTSGSTPTFYRARLFVRQVIGLGGGSETIEADANQLASRYDKRRLIITAGNVSVLDIFDGNTFSHDPRTQFMNWALMTHAAWDYAADSRGYTWGAAAEYIADGWAIRAGRFAQPQQPNGLQLDGDLLHHYGDVLEIGRDYAWGEQAGTVRVLAFRNRAVMSRYDDALALAAATGAPPDLNAVRHDVQTKAGIGLDMEHHLTSEMGVFGRLMWADGQTETYAFTEADRSASAGFSMNGARWGRAPDTLGIAAAVDALSDPHRRILAEGGNTFFLGDGRLTYRTENVLEAYYRVRVLPHADVSVDFQHIAHPGFNADRGPVSFLALRLHVER